MSKLPALTIERADLTIDDKTFTYNKFTKVSETDLKTQQKNSAEARKNLALAALKITGLVFIALVGIAGVAAVIAGLILLPPLAVIPISAAGGLIMAATGGIIGSIIGGAAATASGLFFGIFGKYVVKHIKDKHIDTFKDLDFDVGASKMNQGKAKLHAKNSMNMINKFRKAGSDDIEIGRTTLYLLGKNYLNVQDEKRNTLEGITSSGLNKDQFMRLLETLAKETEDAVKE